MSTLKQNIQNHIKEAMKNKEKEKLSCLRLLQSAIKNKEIDIRPKEITDDEIMAVIKTLMKQRQDSIEQYKKAERPDLAEKEEVDFKILKTYMPEPLSSDEVQTVVTEVISQLKAPSMKDMGTVMKQVLSKTGNRADNKTVSELVRAKLNG